MILGLFLWACKGELPVDDSGPPSGDSAPEVDCGAAHRRGGLDVVRFCEGSFEMGTASGGETHERPVRDVLVYAFDLAIHETTVAEYAVCVESGVCSPVANPDDIPARCNWDKPERDDHPMNCVNFEMATTFCAFVGGRLPSEAAWEYAARSEGQPPL